MLYVAIAGGVVVVVAIVVVLRALPPACDSCRKRMTRATERGLEQGQRVEEEIGSARYHVFACAACKTTKTIRRRRYGLETYRNCVKCGFLAVIPRRAYNEKADTILYQKCRNCAHVNDIVEKVAGPWIPTDPTLKKPSTTSKPASNATKPSSSSGSGSSTGFGGGGSDGGGAGSSW